MASTGKTTNYELSQFIGTDKPSWLGDYNGDMLKIDTALGSINATATTAQTGVASAQSAASAAQQTANAAQQTATANVQDITELKAALTFGVVPTTRLGNANYGNMALVVSDYIQKISMTIGWDSLPSNSINSGSIYYIPCYSCNKNIFKIPVSTQTDAASKVSCGSLSVRYNTSGQNNMVNFIELLAYWDGANTIFYLALTQPYYESFTLVNRVWGNMMIAFTGDFISTPLN